MTAWLVIEGKEEKYTLPRLGNFSIGRITDSDLRLDDRKISRNHAIVQHTSRDEYILIDIASRNGCFVNGERIHTPCELHSGDRIRVGDTRLSFFKDSTGACSRDMEQTIVVDSPQDYLALEEESPATLNIQEITILVADIRGFTTLTEALPIESIASIMSLWFDAATDCVAQHEGVLDKFIGDCVYARWTRLDDPLQPALNALRTACELERLSRQINQEFTDLPFPLRIGVGINTGNAVLDVGVESSAMGDAVNLAFRLEAHSKVAGKDLVLSKNTWCHLPGRDWSSMADTIQVKGKQEPIEVVALDFAELHEYLAAYSSSNL